MRRTIPMTFILLALLCLTCSCEPAPETEAQKKVRYFKNKQAPAIMMGGKIKMETVVAHGDGKIEFQTENQTKYVVEMHLDIDGKTYGYRNLQEVK